MLLILRSVFALLTSSHNSNLIVHTTVKPYRYYLTVLYTVTYFYENYTKGKMFRCITIFPSGLYTDLTLSDLEVNRDCTPCTCNRARETYACVRTARQPRRDCWDTGVGTPAIGQAGYSRPNPKHSRYPTQPPAPGGSGFNPGYN